MKTEYCIKCGGKAEFSVSKPKFCPSCGEPFNRVDSSFSSASRKPVRKKEHEEDYDDDEDDFDDEDDDLREFNINLAALKRKKIFTAEVGSNQRITIGDLTPSNSQGSRETRAPRSGEENLEGADLLRKIQSECRTVKSQTELD
jgi:hypothetical protein